jgi:glycosidase
MTTTARRLSCLVSVLILAALAVAEYPPAHPVAPWIQSAVVYEINTRTFSTEGNFRGIEKRLDDLQHLGVTVLWLMPIHPDGQVNKKGTYGSAYAVRDYYAIDPAFGTKDDFRHLVQEAHRHGLKIIIDIVPNHTAWDSVMMKNPSWYHHDAAGKIIPPNPDWSDVAWLDYSNPQLRSYMLDMLKYWLREFDLDGFRCDVASGVPTDFWDATRPELEKVKSDIIMIAESNKPELLVKAFDIDYAWPFHSTLTNVAENGQPSEMIQLNWQTERDRYPKGALEMRFSDNHDEKRAIARFGELGALAASTLVFTTDGVPLLYNGMEVGDTTESGAPALFEKLNVFWPIAERRPQFLRFYTEMIALRKAHPALQQGDTEWLKNSAPDRIVTYLRKAPGEDFFVAINLSNRPVVAAVDLPAGNYEDVTPALEPGKHRPATPVVALDAWGFRIYHRQP